MRSTLLLFEHRFIIYSDKDEFLLGENKSDRESLLLVSSLAMKRYPNKANTFFPVVVVIVLFLFLCLSCAIGLESQRQTPYRNKDIPCEWTGVKRIVAVGDLHGAYEHFVEILKGTDLVDDKLNWIGGKTHLVQIGDVLDRGDKPRDIFDLAIRLEKEAEAAGGKVHMMIGNHEEMNFANTAFDRERYVTHQQFVSFLPEDYKLRQEKKFRKKSGSRSSKDSTSNGNFSEEWNEIINKSMGKPRSSGRIFYLKKLNELYGDWILGHNVIIKINDIVFVHGGISEMFSKRTLKWINETYRIELDDIRTAIIKNQPPKILPYDRQLYNVPNGPLWYRSLANEESEDFEDDVERILNNLQTNHIVIAHTPHTVSEADMRKYDGKVWVIDTGIADYYRPIGGHVSALIIDNGQFSVWYPKSEKEDLKKTLHKKGE